MKEPQFGQICTSFVLKIITTITNWANSHVNALFLCSLGLPLLSMDGTYEWQAARCNMIGPPKKKRILYEE